ncbi:hypothetical protein TNCV_950261 [Trichonephila clavipes]|nr:hypothetical protein TNCV_950261 [Trichonephila clavipes]
MRFFHLVKDSESLLTTFLNLSEKKEVYRDCGLPFTEIAQSVALKEATVMRICHRWIQKETTDRRGQSPPLLCSTAHDDRRNGVSDG